MRIAPHTVEYACCVVVSTVNRGAFNVMLYPICEERFPRSRPGEGDDQLFIRYGGFVEYSLPLNP